MDDIEMNFISFLILSIIINLIIIFNDELESIYIMAIKEAWKKYPILDISLTKKDGYEKMVLLNSEGINICDCSFADDYQRILMIVAMNINFPKDVLNIFQIKHQKYLELNYMLNIIKLII